MDYPFIYYLIRSNGDNPLALLVASLLDEGGSASKLSEIGRQRRGESVYRSPGSTWSVVRRPYQIPNHQAKRGTATRTGHCQSESANPVRTGMTTAKTESMRPWNQMFPSASASCLSARSLESIDICLSDISYYPALCAGHQHGSVVCGGPQKTVSDR